MIQLPEDQFLHWRQDMEKKQEEQARQMKEFQELAEQLQHENDRLRAKAEQRHDLDERDAQNSGPMRHPTVREKGKKPIALDDVDTSVDNELSSGSSPNPSPIKRKSNKDIMSRRHSHRPTFKDSNGGMLCRATSRGQNPPSQALGNTFILPTSPIPVRPAYPAFGIRPALYMPPTTMIRDPNDILSSPLGQHILEYEPPRGFSMPTFAMFDGSSDPYDHMLHFNQEMTLNVRNDHLLCKVFPASLQGPALGWFHRLPRNLVN